MNIALVPSVEPPDTYMQPLPSPIDLEDIPAWDRYRNAFLPEVAARTLWEAFAVDATRSGMYGGDTEADVDNSSDRAAIKWLRMMTRDEMRGLRERLYPTPQMLSQIAALAQRAPNAAGLLALMRTTVAAALHTSSPIQIPPILLLGPPGVGKTHVARQLATVFGTSVTRVDCAGSTHLNPLTGTNRVWRGADAGAVTRAIVAGTSSSPVLLLDEIDKSHGYDDNDPLGALHQLLEREQAMRFRDECLDIEISAEDTIWIATANDTREILPSLLDRFHVVDIAPPSRDQMHVVVRSLFEETMKAHYAHWFEGGIDDDVIDRVRATNPRRARRLIETACRNAAAAARRRVSLWDVAAAEKLLGR